MNPELLSAERTLSLIRAAGYFVGEDDEAAYLALFAELKRRIDGRGRENPLEYDEMMKMMRVILVEHPEWRPSARRISRAYAEVALDALLDGSPKTYH